MKKIDKKIWLRYFKEKIKLISSLISEHYFLQDIYHHLQRNEKLKTSLFNFYKIIRSRHYELINSALKLEKKI